MPRSLPEADDLVSCRALLRGGSRSFHAASLLLPAHVRGPATALYAFCRVADDAVDLGDDPAAAVAALTRRLDAAYAGTPYPDPVDRAFAATVAAFCIPKSLPEALIEGLAWDAAGRRYADFAALCDYAARVAGSVGVMMALVMGVRAPQALARAADLGVAMQLTNIARDVGEDARAGRLFLPLDWLTAAGIDATRFLAVPRPSPGLAAVVRRLLGEAEGLYARGAAGIGLLPVRCRLGIAAARRIYAAIGGAVAAGDEAAVMRRARVSGGRKLALVLRAAADVMAPATRTDAAALPANDFLLMGVEPLPAPTETSGLIGLMAMFERLERAQRETLGGRLA